MLHCDLVTGKKWEALLLYCRSPHGFVGAGLQQCIGATVRMPKLSVHVDSFLFCSVSSSYYFISYRGLLIGYDCLLYNETPVFYAAIRKKYGMVKDGLATQKWQDIQVGLWV